MTTKEALILVLSDVCCSNGKEFCELCPVYNDGCDTLHTEKELIEAVTVLNNELKNINRKS